MPLQFETLNAALEDQSTYGFNEIRLNSEVATLFKDNQRLKNTIELFCFGDYAHYSRNMNKFIDLSPRAIFKLKQLTLASDALKHNRLQYKHLQEMLDFQSKLELEIFLAESIKANVIQATLFGVEELVKVKSARGRDVLFDNEPEKDLLIAEYGAKSVSDIVSQLKCFCQRVESSYQYLLQVSGEVAPPEQPKVVKKRPGQRETRREEKQGNQRGQEGSEFGTNARGFDADEMKDDDEKEIVEGSSEKQGINSAEQGTAFLKPPQSTGQACGIDEDNGTPLQDAEIPDNKSRDDNSEEIASSSRKRKID